MALTEFHFNTELHEYGTFWTMQAVGQHGADIEHLVSIIRTLSAGGIETEKEESKVAAQPATKTAAKTATKKKERYIFNNFLIGATSDDGKLFQLDHEGRVNGHPGGKYYIYEVSEDGVMHRRTDLDFNPEAKHEDAVAQFRQWAADKGYEIMGSGEKTA